MCLILNFLDEMMKLTKKIGNRIKSKNAPEGFSWTTLFFGAMVPLVRGMPFGVTAKLWIVAIFTLGLGNIYFAFKINEEYQEYLLDEGYEVA